MKNSREFMDDKGIFYRSYRQAAAVLRENPEVANFDCFDVCLEVEYSLLGLRETEAVCWCRHSQLSTEQCRVEAGGRWDLFLGRSVAVKHLNFETSNCRSRETCCR